MKRYIIKRAKGHSLVELSMVALLFAVLAMFTADICILVMGSSTNERACRDACRAAAQADNYATALKLAQAATKGFKTTGLNLFISSPTVDTTSFIYQDFAGSPPPNTSPFVTVTTNTSIKVPAPVFLWAVGYGKGSSSTFTFRKTYSFPIVKTQLYL